MSGRDPGIRPLPAEGLFQRVMVKNVNQALSYALTALMLAGYWAPELEGTKKLVYQCYGVFVFMFLSGTYLIIEIIELFVIWGNIPLMTAVGFVLFSNITQAIKIFFIVFRQKKIMSIVDETDEVLRAVESDEGKEIVRRCNKETLRLFVTFTIITTITLMGWATSAEKGQLPLLAWYPYDTTKSPAFELTYLHQIVPQYVTACLNICKDTMMTTLIALCSCRLRLVNLALRTLCRDMDLTEKYLLTSDQEKVVKSRISECTREHQACLEAATRIQECFSEPMFVQFNISLFIICVTAFQLVSQTGNPVRFFSMGGYLLNMMYQVFLYCYQGNQLSEESADIAGAVYEAPWYAMSVRLRRSLLIVMIRSRRIAKITACKFTTLSIASFTAIIKTSYSLFTLLQQVEEEN